jgi:hypothetical protein
MKKIVKKYGNTLGINFDAEDQKIYGMKEGSLVDLGDIVVEDIDKHKLAEDQLSAVLSNKERMDNGKR